MSILGKYGANAVKYWAPILESAYKGLSTADMWTAIRNTQQQYGLSTPGASAPDVSVIRGYANRLVAASQALANAAPTDTLLPSMMGVAPYTLSDPGQLAASPTYMVRFANTVQANDGTVSTVWQTSVFTSTDMPQTVGELQARIDFNAGELAANASGESSNTPKGTSLGTSGLEITVV